MIEREGKRGQVTIFIILGLIIVGAAALIYFLYPQIQSTIFGTSDPQSFIQTCMEDKIEETLFKISVQGGSVNPGLNFSYYNEELNALYGKGRYPVEYLCYTNKYYLPCVMQQPLLMGHIKSEIKNEIGQAANLCFRDLEQSYKNKGYTTNLPSGETIVDILPDRTIVTFNRVLTITKGESQRYEQFSVLVNNNLYELAAIASSILEWEVAFGDAPTQSYMANYNNIIVEKKVQTDGTKVYIITDINTNDIFQFATRSMAWPPGY